MVLRDGIVVSYYANSIVALCYVVSSYFVVVCINCYVSFISSDVVISDSVAVVCAQDAHFPSDNVEVFDCYIAAREVYGGRGWPCWCWSLKSKTRSVDDYVVALNHDRGIVNVVCEGVQIAVVLNFVCS